MSPEQARGLPVDKRADVWAFGVCLFEALAGRRPFRGEDASMTLAAVLAHEPEWSSLPSSTSPEIRSLLERCLAKKPKERLRDVGDAALMLQDDLSHAEPPRPPPRRHILATVATVRERLHRTALRSTTRRLCSPRGGDSLRR
jgi:serine/threonine-protein kinase